MCGPPYIICEKAGTEEVFTGFAVDILTEIQSKLGFDYKFTKFESYGKRQEDNSWSGMIGQLISSEIENEEEVLDVVLFPTRLFF